MSAHCPQGYQHRENCVYLDWECIYGHKKMGNFSDTSCNVVVLLSVTSWKGLTNVNKKAIKDALKLRMHVSIYYVWVPFKNMSLKCSGFLNGHGAPRHSTHPIQLVSSLVETLKPEVGQKRKSCEKIRCVSDPCHVQQQQLLKQPK